MAIPDEILQRVDRLYVKLAERRSDVERNEAYYEGKQSLRFATDKWREYNAERYAGFVDNWCAPVANAPVERLRLNGFRLDDDPGQSDSEKLLWGDWLRNDMETQSAQGWLHTLVAKRSSVIVWGDPETDEPVSTWERADQVIVEYDIDRPSLRVAALKAWVSDDMEFATLYLPDHLWKFQRRRSETVENRDLTGGTRDTGFREEPGSRSVALSGGRNAWELRGDPVPNPLGEVPVVEFPNRPLLGKEPLSDIAGTIAMQDAINLLWAYLFTKADYASMPARVILGGEVPMMPVLDASGQVVGKKPVDLKKLAQDRILQLPGQNVKIDQWDAANLDGFATVIENCVTHIAAQTRTPPHYLILGKGMVNVNADGMKAAETGLVKRVGSLHLFQTPPTRDVFRLYAKARGNEALADQVRLGKPQWADAENHTEAQLVDAMQKLRALGFPFEWVAERYGLSQTEMDRMLAMRERELATDPVAALSQQLGQGMPAAAASEPDDE